MNSKYTLAPAAKAKRIVAVDFRVDLVTFNERQVDTKWFIDAVTVVMRLVMLLMHKADCALTHRYTRHSKRSRPVQRLRLAPLDVTICQVRCLDCGAVFTILPSAILPYQHYEVPLAQKLLEYNLIMSLGYRFQSILLEDLSPGGRRMAPMVAWRLMKWLGNAIPVATILMKVGLIPPSSILEDEKFVSEAGHRSYIAAIFRSDLIWWIEYIQSTDEATMTNAFLGYKQTVQLLLPEYTVDSATVDGHTPTQAGLTTTFPGLGLQECRLHAQRSLNADIVTYGRANPEVKPERLQRIGDDTWNALATSTSLQQFSQRIRRLREQVVDAPLLESRMKKIFKKRNRLMQHLKTPDVETTSTSLDQAFKWLNRKYVQMQSFMSDAGASAFANAWAIARNFWRFMPGAKRAGQSPVEINGADLSGKAWLEVVNLCSYGVFCQA